MLFPGIVDNRQAQPFLNGRNDFLTVRLQALLDIGHDVERLAAVGNRDGDVLEAVALPFVHRLDDGIGGAHDGLRLLLVSLIDGLEDGFRQLLFLHRQRLVLPYGRRHAERADETAVEILVVAAVLEFGHLVLHRVVHHVGDVKAEPVAVERVTAFLVDDLALGVHHVVVFQQALTHAEMVLFHLLLRPFYGTRNHGRLDDVAFLVAHTVHNGRNPLGGEQTHQVVFQRDEELRRARVALTAGTAAQLTVHTPRLVAFGANDGQTAGLLDAFAQLDVGTTAGHVGGNRHRACAAGLGHDIGLFLMQLGVQDVVRYAAALEHTAQQFRNLDRGGAHEHRPPGLGQSHNLLDNGIVFLALGLVNQILAVFADDGTVGRDADHVQFVYIPEFARFRLGRTGHTGELGIHTEVILQRNRGVGLRGGFHLDVFLGLQSLVQTVRITAAVHDTARLFVHNLDLVVDNDVFHVFLEQRVGLEQLVERMHAVRLDRVVAHNLVLFLRLLGLAQRLFLQLGDLRAHIRQDIVLRVVRARGEEIDAAVGQVNRVELLVNDKQQLVVYDVHVLALFLQVEILGLLQKRLHARLAEELDERLVLRQPTVGLQQQLAALLFVLGRRRARQQPLGFGQHLRYLGPLRVVYLLYLRLELFEILILALERGARNNQRRPRVVNQNRIDLIHNRIVVLALHELFRVAAHIVAQVVEAEFVVRTVGNIG